MSNPSPSGLMTPAQFITKWSRAELSERGASQEHFIDLCRMLGQTERLLEFVKALE